MKKSVRCLTQVDIKIWAPTINQVVVEQEVERVRVEIILATLIFLLATVVEVQAALEEIARQGLQRHQVMILRGILPQILPGLHTEEHLHLLIPKLMKVQKQM